MLLKKWLISALLLAGSFFSAASVRAETQMVKMCLASDPSQCLMVPLAVSGSQVLSVSHPANTYAGSALSRPAVTVPDWAKNVRVGMLDANTYFLFYGWEQWDGAKKVVHRKVWGFTFAGGGAQSKIFENEHTESGRMECSAAEVGKCQFVQDKPAPDTVQFNTSLGLFGFPKKGLVTMNGKPVHMFWPASGTTLGVKP